MYISLFKKTELIHLPQKSTNCFNSRLFAMYFEPRHHSSYRYCL